MEQMDSEEGCGITQQQEPVRGPRELLGQDKISEQEGGR